MNRGFVNVFPAIPRRTLSDFDWKLDTSGRGGDLTAMIAMPDRFHLTSYDVHPHFPSRMTPATTPLTLDAPARFQPKAFQVQDTGLPSALFFHDSFLERPMVHLVENFRRSVYVWNFGKFYPEMLDVERPDLVVYEVIERGIAEFAPLPRRVTDDLARLHDLQRAFANCACIADRLVGNSARLVFRPNRPAVTAGHSPVLEIDGRAERPTVVAVDAGDGIVRRRVLYPGAGTALVPLATWPREIRVETRAGALVAGAPLTLTIKSLDRSGSVSAPPQ
jgi:hypothetical protein